MFDGLAWFLGSLLRAGQACAAQRLDDHFWLADVQHAYALRVAITNIQHIIAAEFDGAAFHRAACCNDRCVICKAARMRLRIACCGVLRTIKIHDPVVADGHVGIRHREVALRIGADAFDQRHAAGRVATVDCFVDRYLAIGLGDAAVGDGGLGACHRRD